MSFHRAVSRCGAVAALCCVLAWPESALARSDVDPQAAADAVFVLTNALRKENGLPPLERDSALAAASQTFAAYMAKTDRYGHEADGREPAERAREHGYDYCLVAENIGYQVKSSGFATEELARAFVEGWRRSPPHRRNMLDADVTDFGAAVAYSEASGRWYGVQLFALPASAAIRFEITNDADTPVDYRLGERRYELRPRVTRTHEGCRLGELVVAWPGGGTSRAEPKPGQRFALSRDGEGRWQLKGL